MKTTVFKSGNSQSVRIPRDLRFPATVKEALIEISVEGFLIVMPIVPDPDESRKAQTAISQDLTNATELLTAWAALPEEERLASARRVRQEVCRMDELKPRRPAKPSWRRTDPTKFPFHGFPRGQAK